MSAVTEQSQEPQHTVTRRIAAEDLTVGSFVTVVQQVTEVISFYWCGETPAVAREQPVQYQHTPSNAGVPYKVLSICLPFVFAEDLNGDSITFDVRRCELAELTNDYVKTVKQQEKAMRTRLLKSLKRARKKAKRRSGKRGSQR